VTAVTATGGPPGLLLARRRGTASEIETRDLKESPMRRRPNHGFQALFSVALSLGVLAITGVVFVDSFAPLLA
jgi:hypothetical protein